MIGFDMKAAKGLFFDRSTITDPTIRAKRRVLSRFGAFVRRTAKGSIRKGKGTSKPGRAPYSHDGSLRNGIVFVYDAAHASVIVGAVRLNKPTLAAGTFTGDPVPGTLEHGGQTGIVEIRGGQPHVRTVRIEPRPFMQPAFDKEIPKFAEMWKDSIRRAG